MAALQECSICGATGLPERLAVHECDAFVERRRRRVGGRAVSRAQGGVDAS